MSCIFIRIISTACNLQENNLFFNQTVDEIRGKTSFIASVEENEICTAQELMRLLREYGWYIRKFFKI